MRSLPRVDCRQSEDNSLGGKVVGVGGRVEGVYLLARRCVVATVFFAVLATPVCWPRLLDSPTDSYACFGSSSRVPGRYIRVWDILEWFRAGPKLVKTIYRNRYKFRNMQH